MREKLDLDLSHPFSHAILVLHISHVREREAKGSWAQIPRYRNTSFFIDMSVKRREGEMR